MKIIFLRIVFITVFSLQSLFVFAQKGDEANYFLSGLRLMGNVGFSRVIAELPYDFSEPINEFNNSPGPAFNIELAKQVSSKWEISASLAFSRLNGNTPHPVFSAVGNHVVMNDLRDEPVIYFNDQIAEFLLIRYSFHPLYTLKKKYKVNPFIHAGVGYVHHFAGLKYKNDASGELIFGKSVGNYSESAVSNAIYILGVGARFPRTTKIELFATFNTKFVNYDFLDVVHNFNTDGSRKHVIGIYSELTVGISWLTLYPLITTEKRKVKKVKNEYLPWYKR